MTTGAAEPEKTAVLALPSGDNNLIAAALDPAQGDRRLRERRRRRVNLVKAFAGRGKRGANPDWRGTFAFHRAIDPNRRRGPSAWLRLFRNGLEARENYQGRAGPPEPRAPRPVATLILNAGEENIRCGA